MLIKLNITIVLGHKGKYIFKITMLFEYVQGESDMPN
jgi:hypothetical protein